ncbi:MAG: sigma-70 family RNA polymerase sigma factor [Deltaproteobacteria bacterium]|nr:sigma-70 family RNA polymerase sigma factor [Deltaproteobacteria bacterium]
MRYLAARIPPDEDPLAVLAALRTDDLYLACACAAGDQRALLEFERIHASEIDVAAARMRAPPATVDEARQILRQQLFVVRTGGSKGIASYSGRGELRAWFRITALREVLRLVKGARKDQPLDDEALYDVLSPADSPELGHMKALYRAEFVAAFREAIASLTAKERTLLRQQAIDGLSVDQLGALYGVHRATVARWVAKARQKLLSRTRRSLMAKLKIGAADLDSILRLVRSRIDLSLDRFLVLSRDR